MMKIFLVSLAIVAIACASSHPVEQQQSGDDGDSSDEASPGDLLRRFIHAAVKRVVTSVVGFVQQRRLLPKISRTTEKFQESLRKFQAKIESCEGSLNPKCNLTKTLTEQITQAVTTKLEPLAVEYKPIIEYLEGAAESVVRAFEDIDEMELSDLQARVMKWTHTFEDVAHDFVQSVKN